MKNKIRFFLIIGVYYTFYAYIISFILYIITDFVTRLHFCAHFTDRLFNYLLEQLF